MATILIKDRDMYLFINADEVHVGDILIRREQGWDPGTTYEELERIERIERNEEAQKLSFFKPYTLDDLELDCQDGLDSRNIPILVVDPKAKLEVYRPLEEGRF